MNNRKYICIVIFFLFIILGIRYYKKIPHAHYSIDKIMGKKGHVVPLTIVGSGPAGLSAAVYGARAHIPTLVIEGPNPGGLLMGTTYVENWPGQISILGKDIIGGLKNQAYNLGAQFCTDSIQSVDLNQWPFVLQTENGATIQTLALIIATGAQPKKLHVPGEQEYWAQGVTSCAICDAPFFKGKRVVVVGGGDSAVEQALQLAAYAQEITLLVRSDHMRAAARMQEHLAHVPHITVRYNVQVHQIKGDGTKVTAIKLFDTQKNITEDMSIDGVFLAIGHEPNSFVFRPKVRTDKNGYILVKDQSQHTNIPGIFAAGDVEDTTYRQAGVAAGNGIKAALDAVSFLQDCGVTQEILANLEPYYFHPTAHERDLVAYADTLTFLQEHIAMHDLVVADFYAEYCPSCMQMLPVFEAVASTLRDKCAFIKVDVEHAEDIVREYAVQKVPCLLVFKNGSLVARYTRTMTKQELVEFLQQFLD